MEMRVGSVINIAKHMRNNYDFKCDKDFSDTLKHLLHTCRTLVGHSFDMCWIRLGHFWQTCVALLENCSNTFRTLLGHFFKHFLTTFKIRFIHCWDTCWALVGHFWETDQTLFGHFLHTLGTIAGHFSDTFETLVGHVWDTCGTLFGPCGTCL
jgi:hypothetical protein